MGVINQQTYHFVGTILILGLASPGSLQMGHEKKRPGGLAMYVGKGWELMIEGLSFKQTRAVVMLVNPQQNCGMEVS